MVLFCAEAGEFAFPDDDPASEAKLSADDTRRSVEVSTPWGCLRLRRFEENPLIRPDMLPDDQGENINGPCVVRVPEWIDEPLGRYYMYFAHHGGRHIRLACADRLRGPWRIHEPGLLHLDDLPVKASHIASPEVLIDEANRTIRLYFHVPLKEGQVTGGPHSNAAWRGQTTHLALSHDGLDFEARPEVVSSFYLRVFRHKGIIYGICKESNEGSVLCRSRDGLATFERGPRLFPRARHWGLLRRGNTLWGFFSRIGDAPERILMTQFDLTKDWSEWPATAAEPVTVLEPEAGYEGVGYEVARSAPSAATGVRQLRDPYVYEEDGRTVLFYSTAGESGIAAAELAIEPRDE